MPVKDKRERLEEIIRKRAAEDEDAVIDALINQCTTSDLESACEELEITETAVRCVVACSGGPGGSEPCFFGITVSVTEDERKENEHLDMADTAATKAFYSRPFIVFAEDAGPAWLFDKVFAAQAAAGQTEETHAAAGTGAAAGGAGQPADADRGGA